MMRWRGGLFSRDVRDEARRVQPPVVPVMKAPPAPPAARERIKVEYYVTEDGGFPRSVPAPGLYETISGEPLPPASELKERYGDPDELPPVNAAAEMADGQPLPTTGIEAIKAYGVFASDVGRVDFREMLTSDAAWSVKSRLDVTLGRPYLATQLAEQLHPQTAAQLCDRLEQLLAAAEEAVVARLTYEVAEVVDTRIQEWKVDQARRAREVTRERFAHPSRFD